MESLLRTVLTISCLFLHSNCLISNDPVLPVPLNVIIWTAGLPEVSPDNLASSLKAILPRHFPVVEGNKPVHDVQLLLNYEASRAPDQFLERYEAFVAGRPKRDDGIHYIFVDELANFLRIEMDTGDFKASFPIFDTFTIPILVVNSQKIEKHAIISSSNTMEQCTLSVMSSVAFLDLSAKICDVSGSIAHHAKQIRWSSPQVTAPFPFTYVTSSKVAYTPTHEAYASHLTSRIAGIVTSAVEAVSTGNLKWRPAHTTQTIYCPIVLLVNGEPSADEHAPNIPAIENWLQSILLPHQEVILVTTVHHIDEHPQLSVAIASSHMTYATSIPATNDLAAHVELIPYIDSKLLFHEIASVGDRLCDLLLHQTGHGESLRSILQEEKSKVIIGPKVMAGKNKKEENLSSAVVVPVFIIGNLHIHVERHLSEAEDGKTKTEEHFPSAKSNSAVQPLFDKDSLIAIDEETNAILILHADEKSVSTFSPHTEKWREIDITDVDSRIAEGLTRALTGFNAPHTQQQRSDVIDLTWTHGMHPYHPYGSLPFQAETLHTLFTTSIRRGVIIARAHRLMQRAISISHRASALGQEISDGFAYIHSLHGSSKQVRPLNSYITIDYQHYQG